MRFKKILSVCFGVVLLVSATTRHRSAGAAKSRLTPFIAADGGDPLPIPPLMADGGDPLPIPPLMADGGDPLPIPPLMADGGDPLPIPPLANGFSA
jgi:hypothetical protein